MTSNPAGIDCGLSCSAIYDVGTAVALSAQPGPFSVFMGWSGGGCSGTGPCNVTLAGDTTVTATFAFIGIPGPGFSNRPSP